MEQDIIVKWKIRESASARILQRIPELVQKSRAERGNLAYEVYQSEANPNELILHECYVDAGAAEAHRRSEHYQTIVVREIVPHLEVREVMQVRKFA